MSFEHFAKIQNFSFDETSTPWHYVHRTKIFLQLIIVFRVKMSGNPVSSRWRDLTPDEAVPRYSLLLAFQNP
jgi:hypothetical protein